MRSFLVSFAVLMALIVIGGLAFIYSGLFDVAASEPHWSITRWVLETTRTRSIKAHSAEIEVPSGLDDPARLLIGVDHFAAHCAVCHGAPGVPKGDIGEGLNPQPPNLAHSSEHYTPSEVFWIIKHGIKMTGMPSWADHNDDELWATVAFIEKLPGMSDQEYARLVTASRSQAGRHHDGQEPQSGPTPTEKQHYHPEGQHH